MARFNKKSQGTKTINLAGGVSYSVKTEQEIISILLTSLLQNQFYRGADSTESKLVDLISKVKDKTLIAKAAIYARKTFGMRSITHVVGAEIGKLCKGEEWTKNYFYSSVYRPDDILETLSCYLNKYGFPLPKAMQKGFAKKLSEFNEYQLAKYSGKTKSLKMVDAVNLLHPKNSPALKKLMTGKLESAETWETGLVKAGQESESEEDLKTAKAEVWEKLLTQNKLGYLALLKNLRNILQQAPNYVDLACSKLTDSESIKKSLVFPFRYLRAMKELQSQSSSRKIITALSIATEISLENCPSFDGKTLVVLDESGSMTTGKCGTLSCAEVGAMLAAILYKKNDADFLTFSDNARFLNIDSTSSVLSLINGIYFVGGGTDFSSIFSTIKNKYDRIFIISDMQGQEEVFISFELYKKKTGANPKLYGIDLTGYGTLMFPGKHITTISGFSDKIFDLIKLIESEGGDLIKEINKVSFT